jgi:hypothetical protein
MVSEGCITSILFTKHPFLSEITEQELSEKVLHDRKRVHLNDWYTVSSREQESNINDGYT